MTALSVRHVQKSFGAVRALGGVSFDLDQGSTAALLGPSGCGKTTLLRIIAGFERPDGGAVLIGGGEVTGPGVLKRPELRSVGYVAQEGALFPHLTVAANIEFSLTRAERRSGSRLAELLDLVSLDRGHLRRHPHELSGGQQQRVALARALARRPTLMLLDEPFAALDASLRLVTRELMAAALAAEGVTTVLVTHDQEEALSFADHVVVLRDGLVSQAGSPRVVYERPADAWTAGFVGDAVLIAASVSAGVADSALGAIPVAGEPISEGRTTILLRPEQLRLIPMTAGSSREVVAGEVLEVSYRGHDTVVHVRLAADGTVVRSRALGAGDWLRDGASVAIQVLGSARVVSGSV